MLLLPAVFSRAYRGPIVRARPGRAGFEKLVGRAGPGRDKLNMMGRAEAHDMKIRRKNDGPGRAAAYNLEM